ncbi:MAG: recombinase family protein, partial [Archaeoglobaceae archaeon]|nr:recombinase family protein [Archaeoglobaceae archaeon]
EIEKVDAIVVWSIDRLGRNMLDVLKTVIELEERNVKVVSVKEEFLQMLDENVRKLILSILTWFAEFERKRIRERQIEAWNQGKQKGRPKKVSDSEILAFWHKYSKYGSKKYVWFRLNEELEKAGKKGIHYITFLRKLKKVRR